jgi:hypothetical protein
MQDKSTTFPFVIPLKCGELHCAVRVIVKSHQTLLSNKVNLGEGEQVHFRRPKNKHK